MSDVLRAPHALEYTYTRSVGPVVEFAPDESGRQPPEFVIGFAVTPEQALEKFKQWIREILDKTDLQESDVTEYSGEVKQIGPVTVATYQILTHRSDKKEEFPHFKIFGPDGKLRAEDTSDEAKARELILSWIK